MSDLLSTRLRGLENLFNELDEKRVRDSMDNEAILALLGEVTSLRHIALRMERKLARYEDAERLCDMRLQLKFDEGQNANVTLFPDVAESHPARFTDTMPEGAA